MQYGLIGEHLGYSYSREIHEAIADYHYELCELRPDELDAFLTKRDFCAINVTIPYKQAVIPYLSEISSTAKAIGAVNTVVNRGGKLYGDNTDFAGMRALIAHMGLVLTGKTVLILGTGGTSKTAHAVAESLGAREIFHVSRSGKGGALTYEHSTSVNAQIIINTTPVGMYPHAAESPIDITPFAELEGIVDAIYHPLRTTLVLSGLERGIKASSGLYMLAAQAVYASAVFRGIEVDETLTDKAFRLVSSQKENIVLIGMPSCGKTTIGTLLAAKSGRTLVDTDALIVEKVGMPIAEYFALHGEEAFRNVESEVIAEVSARSGCIIATGGGAILRGENVRALKSNGTLVFLDRALSNLITTDDRPLSANRALLTQRFTERYPLYRRVADHIVDGNTAPEAVANSVWEELSR